MLLAVFARTNFNLQLNSQNIFSLRLHLKCSSARFPVPEIQLNWTWFLTKSVTCHEKNAAHLSSGSWLFYQATRFAWITLSIFGSYVIKATWKTSCQLNRSNFSMSNYHSPFFIRFISFSHHSKSHLKLSLRKQLHSKRILVHLQLKSLQIFLFPLPSCPFTPTNLLASLCPTSTAAFAPGKKFSTIWSSPLQSSFWLKILLI